MKSQLLTRGGLYHLLSRLKETPGNFVTIYIEPARFPGFLDRLSLGPACTIYADEIKETISAKAIIQGTHKYRTGLAIFWNGVGNKYVILPPFPPGESKVSTGEPDISTICQILDKKFILGVVLVTWGLYAIGIFDAGNLIVSKTGTGHIHKKHKKGGSSAKRFARRTEEQKKEFLKRVSNRIEEKFGAYNPDHIFFGGNRLIVSPLLQECRYLQSRAHIISPRILDIRYADREALVSSPEEISKALVFTI